MANNSQVQTREREDFSKIHTSLAIPNLIALLLLSPVIFKLTREYWERQAK